MHARVALTVLSIVVIGARKRVPQLRVVGDARASTTETHAASTAPGSPLDDGELLEACRRGDPSAAGALHARLRPLVDRTVGRLLGRKDARCEDLAQVALIEIVRSLAQFRAECSLDTWAMRVTARAVYKEIRRRKLESRFIAMAEDDEPASGVDLSADVEARSSLRRVREHLAQLDPVKAWTLVLHDVCGYDLKEIAEITEASLTAAQSRLFRGRAELQTRLEGDPELADMLTNGGRRR